MQRLVDEQPEQRRRASNDLVPRRGREAVKRKTTALGRRSPPPKKKPELKFELEIREGFITFDDVERSTFQLDSIVGRTVEYLHIREIRKQAVFFDITVSKCGLFTDPKSMLIAKLDKPYKLPWGTTITYVVRKEKRNSRTFFVFRP